MLVQMRTKAQAARVAELCAARPVLKDAHPTRTIEVDDFEAVRGAVESVSTLFTLVDPDTDEAVASGWSIRGAIFEVEWPSDPSLVWSHFGGSRFAYNWALGTVKTDMDARTTDPTHESTPWTLGDLRKRWNQEKHQKAPWWADNSKEAYATGIDDLVRGLSNWDASRRGVRKGRPAGFPRFKRKGRCKNSVRFTTGVMRIAADRRSIHLPVIGPLRSKENTRRLERPLAQGRARLLNMTLTERWGRLFVSIAYAIRTPVPQALTRPGVVAGVDLGLRTLATITDTDGRIIEVRNPAPLRAALAQRRAAGRQLSRRIPGSRGYERAKANLVRMDRRAVYLRRNQWHQLTHLLTTTYSEIHIEDLDLAAMKRSMGRRAFRRSVSDAALGMFRPMLTDKAAQRGGRVVIVDRWYASSQIHHGCGCRLIAPTKLAKKLICATTGELVDRDINAARNIRDWSDSPPPTTSRGPVGATAPVVSTLVGGNHGDAGSALATRRGLGSDRQSFDLSRASRGEARTDPDVCDIGQGTSKRGAV